MDLGIVFLREGRRKRELGERRGSCSEERGNREGENIGAGL